MQCGMRGLIYGLLQQQQLSRAINQISTHNVGCSSNVRLCVPPSVSLPVRVHLSDYGLSLRAQVARVKR